MFINSSSQEWVRFKVSISYPHGCSVMEDTDSMPIVATERGGLVPCPGRSFQNADGRSAIRALSWNEVAEIVARFMPLNPYTDKSRSILKIKRDNHDPKTGKQRQVCCLAIASKRYALFLRDDEGNPVRLSPWEEMKAWKLFNADEGRDLAT